MRRWLLDVLHNCVAHPLLPFLPRRWGDALHDATAPCEPEPEPVTVTVTPSVPRETVTVLLFPWAADPGRAAQYPDMPMGVIVPTRTDGSA